MTKLKFFVGLLMADLAAINLQANRCERVTPRDLETLPYGLGNGWTPDSGR